LFLNFRAGLHTFGLCFSVVRHTFNPAVRSLERFPPPAMFPRPGRIVSPFYSSLVFARRFAPFSSVSLSYFLAGEVFLVLSCFLARLESVPGWGSSVDAFRPSFCFVSFVWDFQDRPQACFLLCVEASFGSHYPHVCGGLSLFPEFFFVFFASTWVSIVDFVSHSDFRAPSTSLLCSSEPLFRPVSPYQNHPCDFVRLVRFFFSCYLTCFPF